MFSLQTPAGGVDCIRLPDSIGSMPVPIKIVGKYYNTEEAGKLLGLDAETVRRYCSLSPPKIRGEKLGRDWMIPAKEVDRYKADRRNPGRPRDER